MFRQAFSDIPQDIIDASVIDGCNEFQVFYRITFPLLKPTISTVAIFTFVWVWNDFIWPLILLQDSTKETVTLGLMTQRGQFLSNWAILTAGLAIGFLPVLILYFVFQKQFIQGITMGSLKE